jgi:hypothetical protein
MRRWGRVSGCLKWPNGVNALNGTASRNVNECVETYLLPVFDEARDFAVWERAT